MNEYDGIYLIRRCDWLEMSGISIITDTFKLAYFSEHVKSLQNHI